MKHVKFIKRVKKWICNEKNKSKEMDIALKGEGYTFLRTTSRPCNCAMCTYQKYKRTPKHKVIKEAIKE